MFRLFVALDLPAPVKERLSGLCSGVPGAIWVSPEQIHLTLRFIGEVDGGVRRDIADALSGVDDEPFQLELKGMGCFPPRRQPKSLWVGVSRNDALIHLHHKIDTALVRLGLPREGRKFLPHVRLARLKDARVNKLAGYLTANSLFRLEPFEITEFGLYSSFLSSQGAIYQLEESFPLISKGAFPDEKFS
ncbi:MAG: RNA 2',3'-cyclic phosphodiesterase [Candidatus Zixiibacteriota bacterium]